DARQQSHLLKNLKAVTDAHHQPSLFSVPPDGVCDGGKTGDGTATKVVSVRESSRENDCVDTLQISVFMPQKACFFTQDVLSRMVSVVVAIRTWKNDDSKYHWSSSTSKLSLIGLERTFRTISSVIFRTLAGSDSPLNS